MNAAPTTFALRRVSVLLRGEAAPIRGWVERSSADQLARNVVVIVAGAALYGAAMGTWRAPLQGLVWAAQQKRGDKTSTLTPEFGPPGYLHPLPFTHAPVSDLWDICHWQACRQQNNFAAWRRNKS